MDLCIDDPTDPTVRRRLRVGLGLRSVNELQLQDWLK